MAGSSLFGKPTGMVCWKFRAAGTAVQCETSTDARGSGGGAQAGQEMKNRAQSSEGKR